MPSNKIVELIKESAEEAALSLGLELVDVEFVKEGTNRVLRIYIDKDGGISTDDCEKLSRVVERVLDEKDPIETAYTLEVSSAGLDRPLKKDSDYVRFAGKIIDIKLYRAINGSKKYRGELIGRNNGIVKIVDENGNELEFEKKDTASVKLAVIF